MSEVSSTEFCPHCNTLAKFRLCLTHPYDKALRNTWDREKSSAELLKAYFVFSCVNCEELILYHWNEPIMYHLVGDELEVIFDEDVREEVLQDEPDAGLPYIVWPDHGDSGISDHAPDSVKKLYQAALELKDKDPNLFAVQIRRALENICREKGAGSGTLSQMLRELSGKGIFPPTIAEIANELRATGNKGAHADSVGVTREDAAAIDELFQLIIGYVYDAPAKLNAYRALISDLIQENDNQTIH